MRKITLSLALLGSLAACHGNNNSNPAPSPNSDVWGQGYNEEVSLPNGSVVDKGGLLSCRTFVDSTGRRYYFNLSVDTATGETQNHRDGSVETIYGDAQLDIDSGAFSAPNPYAPAPTESSLLSLSVVVKVQQVSQSRTIYRVIANQESEPPTPSWNRSSDRHQVRNNRGDSYRDGYRPGQELLRITRMAQGQNLLVSTLSLSGLAERQSLECR